VLEQFRVNPALICNIQGGPCVQTKRADNTLVSHFPNGKPLVAGASAMVPKHFILSFAAHLLFITSSHASPQNHEEKLPPVIAITHVTVIQGSTPGPIGDQTVLIRANRIFSVGKSSAIKLPPGARVIDGHGKFLIPGLWDAHVHITLAGESALQLFIANGATGVRDMVGDPQTLRIWQRRIADGSLIGPRIKMAGFAIESAAWLTVIPKVDQMFHLHLSDSILQGRIGITTSEDARQAVDHIANQSMDFVKFRTMPSRDAFLAMADEAAKRKIWFVGHEPVVVSLTEASGAGQRSVEHLPFMSMAKSSHAARAATFATLAHNGTWVDPTLVASVGYRGTSDQAVISIIEDKSNSIDPRRKFLSPSLLEFWRAQIVIKQVEEPQDWPALLRQAFADIAEMRKLGVPIVAGTDIGAPLVYPGFSLHDELAMLVEKGGFSPAQAIESATLQPAKLLGMETDLGTIQPGKLADLVLLDCDPLQNIANTKAIFAVIADGRLYDRAALDAILLRVRTSIGEETREAPVPSH
jgi:amidohydrolase family protein